MHLSVSPVSLTFWGIIFEGVDRVGGRRREEGGREGGREEGGGKGAGGGRKGGGVNPLSSVYPHP